MRGAETDERAAGWRTGACAMVAMAGVGAVTAAAPAAVIARKSRPASHHPVAGASYVGHPFPNEIIRLRVARDRRSMALVGEFAFSYGCTMIADYGFADAKTLSRPPVGAISLMAAPRIAIRADGSFSGTRNDARGDRKISGRFTGRGRTATAAFSYSQPLVGCGVFTKHFTLRAG